MIPPKPIKRPLRRTEFPDLIRDLVQLFRKPRRRSRIKSGNSEEKTCDPQPSQPTTPAQAGAQGRTFIKVTMGHFAPWIPAFAGIAGDSMINVST